MSHPPVTLQPNIWIAASDGDREKVEALLQSQSDISPISKDENGYTPIHAAAAYGHVDLLRLLCTKYGGDVNIKDTDGDSPLFHVEDVEVAKVLIDELGADSSLANNEGKTAFQVLLENDEDPLLVSFLRQKCGDSNSSGDNNAGGIADIEAKVMQEFKDKIRYSLMEDESGIDPNDPEMAARRAQIEQILQGDNTAEALETYIRDAVRDQVHGESTEMNAKRRR